MGRYPPELEAKYRDASKNFAKELQDVDHLPEGEARAELERICKRRGINHEKMTEALSNRRKGR